MRLFFLISLLLSFSAWAVVQEEVFLRVGQEHIIDMIHTEKENILWEALLQEPADQAVIDAVMYEMPIPTFWYHPDLAPALSHVRFVVRALMLGQCGVEYSL